MHLFKTKAEPKTKKRQRSDKTAETGPKGTQCGHCGHVRETDATVPEWQCPCCSSAYNKVDPVLLEQEKQQRKQAKLEQKQEEEQKSLRGITLFGMFWGSTIAMSSLGSFLGTCARVAKPTSPAGIAAGLVVIAASVGYFYWKSRSP